MVAFETFRSNFFKALRERGMPVSQLVRYGFVLNDLADFMGYSDPEVWKSRDLERFYEFRKPHLDRTQRQETQEAVAVLSLLVGGGDTQPPPIFSNGVRAKRVADPSSSVAVVTGTFSKADLNGGGAERTEETNPRHQAAHASAAWERDPTGPSPAHASAGDVTIDAIPTHGTTILAITWKNASDLAISSAFQKALQMTRSYGGARWMVDTSNGSNTILQPGHWFPHWLQQARRLGVEYVAVVAHAEKLNMRQFGVLDTSQNASVAGLPASPPEVAFFYSVGPALMWLRDPE